MLDLTSFAAALKEHYTDDRVMHMVYKDNPLLALIPKYEDFGGESLRIPLIYANPQGRSASFAAAQANKGSSKLVKFDLVRARDYSLASIDNETIEASKGNSNAFMEALTMEVDNAIHSATRALARDVYGSGSGTIGVMANSSFATPTIQLSQPEDIVNFEVGMVLVLSAANGGGSVKTGNLTVVGVDRSAGTLTVNANISAGVATAAQNDFIFPIGDYDARLRGLQAWVPGTSPGGSDNFFGVNRSVDVSRLAGQRLDVSSKPLEEGLIDGAALVHREGGTLTHYMMNHESYADLEKALGSKVQYVESEIASIAFRGIRLSTTKGFVTVMADHNCPVGRAFGLHMPTWKLYSLGKAIKILQTDGLKMLRESTADAVEVRVGGYRQLGSRAPGYNINLKIR
jgi:hypothetical protein